VSRNVAVNLTKEEYFRIREQIKSGIDGTGSSERAVRILMRWEADFRKHLELQTKVSNRKITKQTYLSKVGYILHLKEKGCSPGSIANVMNELRTRSSTNKKWTAGSVRSVLNRYTTQQLPDDFDPQKWIEEARVRASALRQREIENLKKTITAKIGLDG